MRKIYTTLKRICYFPAAGYFRFFARIYLKRWHPTIIVATGSSGKTTLLHLLAAAYGPQAVVSYHANSTFGISFNLLGFERETYGIGEWLSYIVLSPFRAFRKTAPEKLYIAEADAERPGEGRFLAEFLHPDVVIWLSLDEAHGMNYDRVVKKVPDGSLTDPVKKAMAREFGFFLEHAARTSIVNADNPYIQAELGRAHSAVIGIGDKDVLGYKVGNGTTAVRSSTRSYTIPGLIPREAALSVIAVEKASDALGTAFPADMSFASFTLPPGRSSVFKGIRDTTLIDSSYNATMDGMKSMLRLMKGYDAAGPKWLVLGDMIEQGKSEKAGHEEIAAYILDAKPARVVLVGPRLREHTYPLLQKALGQGTVVSFLMPGEAWKYLDESIRGGETVLFKGARYLEGVVERMLANKADAQLLCRRGRIWDIKRASWGI